MALASTAELADRLGLTFTQTEATRAEALLKLAGGLVKGAARQQIERVTNDTLTVIDAPNRLLLPERPVISVASVTEDGVVTINWEIDGDYLVGQFGRGVTVVTYTHGFEPVPDAIKAIVLEVATRAWVNPGSVGEEGYGSERVRYAAAGMTLTDAERTTVRDVVRRGSEALELR